MTPELESADAERGIAQGFEGYARESRGPGVRNTVVVLPSVICSGVVAESIADAVPEATVTPHDHGCGQIGADKDQTRRTLLNVSENPNVAGVVVVGLGCETLDSEALAADLSLPVRQTAIQTAGGTDEAIEEGIAAAEELVADAREQGSHREQFDLSDLTLGVTVSDLADSTVESVTPAVGALIRRVVDAGGRVVVGGLGPLVPHADSADDLTADAETADALRDALERHRDEAPPTPLRRSAGDRDPTDVSLLWDREPLVDVLAYGEKADHDAGVAVVGSMGGFEETSTALTAAGAQVVVHGTADGIPTGHPVVPVLKVTGDPDTAAALADDIDVDAPSASPDELVEGVLATADGQETAAEGHGLTSFAISRAGPSL